MKFAFGAYPRVVHLKGVPNLTSNIRLGWITLTVNKHSSLLGLFVSYEVNKVSPIRPWMSSSLIFLLELTWSGKAGNTN